MEKLSSNFPKSAPSAHWTSSSTSRSLAERTTLPSEKCFLITHLRKSCCQPFGAVPGLSYRCDKQRQNHHRVEADRSRHSPRAGTAKIKKPLQTLPGGFATEQNALMPACVTGSVETKEFQMKTLKIMLAAAVLVAGMTAASAQGTTRQMDEQAGGNSQSVERNPGGSVGGSKMNPSPRTGVSSRKSARHHRSSRHRSM
jgi:hypothetical protein